jgi:putative addiction module component (TIGR02574 family)
VAITILSENFGAIDVAAEIGSVFDLTPAEKLQLVEDLWDDLAAKPEEVPLHEWQRAELDRRQANLMKHPESLVSWEEVKRGIRSRYGR